MGADTRILAGLISDTHGLLRPQVHTALEGVDIIIHAGDVGGHEILDQLRIIAPVHAVHGNTDRADDPDLPATLKLSLGSFLLHVSHGHELANPTPAKLAASYTEPIIVYGHTHRPMVKRIGEQLVINPGAAGQRRFDIVPSVALLRINGAEAEVEIVPLD